MCVLMKMWKLRFLQVFMCCVCKNKKIKNVCVRVCVDKNADIVFVARVYVLCV